MKERILLGLILVYSIISRFWFLGKFPPLLSPAVLPQRFLTAILSILGILFFYFFIKKIGYKKKITLIATYILTSLAWTIEQGRIVSQVSNTLSILFFLFLVIHLTKNIVLKIIFSMCIPIVLFFFYPQLWFFREIIPNGHFFENIFTLLSPDFLFFHNITFWWGGVREVGVLYFSLLPFFLIGFYYHIYSTKRMTLFFFIGILLLSAASPFFPESREFFFSLPFFSLVIASGLEKIFSQRGKGVKWGSIIFIFILIYEMMQFFHYYTVHHVQQVENNEQKIHEAF